MMEAIKDSVFSSRRMTMVNWYLKVTFLGACNYFSFSISCATPAHMSRSIMSLLSIICLFLCSIFSIFVSLPVCLPVCQCPRISLPPIAFSSLYSCQARRRVAFPTIVRKKNFEWRKSWNILRILALSFCPNWRRDDLSIKKITTTT